MSAPRPTLTPADLAALARIGISPVEARRQLELLTSPPPSARLLRPATIGDGIERIEPRRAAALVARGAAARDAGRITKFVPASGAATRMFRGAGAALERRDARTLAELAAADDEIARDVAAFFAALPHLALGAPLRSVLARDGLTLGSASPLSVLERLLGESGLDAARLPKALLPFHETPSGVRSAFEEQLLEGIGYLRDAAGRSRFHFTVPPGGSARFRDALERILAGRKPDDELDVAFSEQHSSTDTLALEENGEIARGADGAPRLRPSGHGALLPNLAELGADLVVLKNIDNVLPEGRHAEIAHWKLLLVGRLVELEEQMHRLQRAARPGSPDAERVFRPLRVAGVVTTTGEPGGGPFWIANEDASPSLQIVERSQVDPHSAGQDAIWHASTHFNPVDLALSLRDAFGKPYDLARFVDPASSFVTTKHEGGKAFRALERPGLWNGAMARWNTVFVEVPVETFAPVKTILDLARPEHRTR